MASSVLAKLFFVAASVSALELTPDNYDELTAGKIAFVKFYAPWCGHCKKMAPAWNALMDDFKDHETKIIAEVDCTAAGKPLCDANGVKGFPTLKFGDPSDLSNYEGGRDEASLRKHATEKLLPTCSPKNLGLCSDEKKAEMEKLMAMDDAALAKLVQGKEAELEAVEATFKSSVEALQKQYEASTEAKEEATEAVMASGLGAMKAVKAFKASTAKKDEL